MVIAHCMSTGNKTKSPSPPVKKSIEKLMSRPNERKKNFRDCEFSRYFKIYTKRATSFHFSKNRDFSSKRQKKRESDSRFLCTRTKKQIAEYISIYKNIHICMYVCSYVRTYMNQHTQHVRDVRTRSPARRSCRNDARSSELSDNQNECLGSDPK